MLNVLRNTVLPIKCPTCSQSGQHCLWFQDPFLMTKNPSCGSTLLAYPAHSHFSPCLSALALGDTPGEKMNHHLYTSQYPSATPHSLASILSPPLQFVIVMQLPSLSIYQSRELFGAAPGIVVSICEAWMYPESPLISAWSNCVTHINSFLWSFILELLGGTGCPLTCSFHLTEWKGPPNPPQSLCLDQGPGTKLQHSPRAPWQMSVRVAPPTMN